MAEHTPVSADSLERRHRPADWRHRQHALDPERSFIVQAPAGSGKTGLLTQRYLRLLTTCKVPEEVVAITFTRKAAAEMRERILDALAKSDGPEPAADYEKQTWQLARKAMAHAREHGWGLRENPQRLRIRTIDSLCGYLARQMPLAAGFGDAPGVDEDAAALHAQAARAVLRRLDEDDDTGDALATLLTQLDNDHAAAEALIAGMLARRDQWLRHLGRDDIRRSDIEAALQRTVEDHLAALDQAIPVNARGQLPSLARYAARHVIERSAAQDKPAPPLAACDGMGAMPPPRAEALAQWDGLRNLLLTNTGGWRKSVTVAIGFPAAKQGPAAERKDEMQQLLQNLSADEALAEQLHALTTLPAPAYSDAEWAVIEAVLRVSVAAVLELNAVFAAEGRTDFTEQSLAAQRALGQEEAPTDLALRLDYQVRHLLVDEFQDTSHNQYGLVRALTAGWEPGDGRTLFLVGDPMQSIYGFREAEVGLFLDAWGAGTGGPGHLGHITLEPLQLETNFRSEQGIIEWVNTNFPRVLPPQDDKERGAVRYAPSRAHHPPGRGQAVRVHAAPARDDAAEADEVLSIVRAALDEPPGDDDKLSTCAILVRGRAHAADIVQRLRAEGIRFQAVDIAALGGRPAVLDAMSLTLALLHLADRVHWLALLHGPLVGLRLADLHALTGDDEAAQHGTLLALLEAPDRLARLSRDGRARAERARDILIEALEEQHRRPFRQWVEGCWLALGGPAAHADAGAAEDVERYFRMLQALEARGVGITPERLAAEAEKLFSSPDPRADGRLQIMTMHKAKGLEFDHVILPGLGRATGRDEEKALYWVETTAPDGKAELLFGPVKDKAAGERSRTSDYIRVLEKEKSRFEDGRLVYVATTRARRRLHLFAHANWSDARGEFKPAGGSLIEQLWPALGPQWDEMAPPDEPEGNPGADGHALPDQTQVRLASGWAPPAAPADILPAPAEMESGERVPYEWAGPEARAVGIVVHRFLQYAVEHGIEAPQQFTHLHAKARQFLRGEGMGERELEAATARVEQALGRVYADERGRWMLRPDHAESACELPITLHEQGQARQLVIDRTFIDADGTRWIIDYKTGTHEGGDLEHFLNEEVGRYAEQLARYARALRLRGEEKIRTALYYPLVEAGWREVAWEEIPS